MGANSKAKAFFISTFPECFFNELQLNQRNLRMVKIVLFDITYITKYGSDRWKTGIDFIWGNLIQEFERYFEQGAEMVYLCFDRGTPKNKWAEHQKRYKNITEPFETPTCRQQVVNIIAESSGYVRDRAFSIYNNRKSKNMEILNNEEKDSIERFMEGRKKRLTLSEPDELLVMADDRLPSKENWERTYANFFLKRQMMHYITCSLVKDMEDLQTTYTSGVFYRRDDPLVYTPSGGKMLCLHGGLSHKPNHGGTMSVPSECHDEHVYDYKDVPYKPDDFLVTIGSEGPLNNGNYKRVIGKHFESERYPRSTISNLKEGEIACTYYSLQHTVEDQLIVSGDGDMISILLLASRNRLYSTTSRQLRNSIFLLLRLPRKIVVYDNQKMGETQISADTYVDINMLYEKIFSHPSFGKYDDPIATYLSATALMGNDYIKGFAPGFGGGCNTDTKTPWLYYPLLVNPDKYKHMIRIMQNDSENNGEDCNAGEDVDRYGENENNRKRRKYFVTIDESLFLQYTKECYYHKYRKVKAIENNLKKAFILTSRGIDFKSKKRNESVDLDNIHKDPELLEIAIECISNHLNKGSATNRMMSNEVILGHCRRLVWLFDYWSNAYVGDCSFPNPCLSNKKGQSFYGWLTPKSEPSTCITTDDVTELLYPIPGIDYEDEEESSTMDVEEVSTPTSTLISTPIISTPTPTPTPIPIPMPTPPTETEKQAVVFTSGPITFNIETAPTQKVRKAKRKSTRRTSTKKKTKSEVTGFPDDDDLIASENKHRKSKPTTTSQDVLDLMKEVEDVMSVKDVKK